MVYQFKCEKCGKDAVVECSLSDYERLKTNIKCECGEKMKRELSPFPAHSSWESWRKK